MDGDTGYGEASEFAGGGFMPPPSTPQQGIGGGGSTFSPSAGGRRPSMTVLYPLTLRHFFNCYSSAGGDTLSVNGIEVNNVVLVGKVLSMESRTTDLTFLLDDGTGKIEIRKWHDDQEHEREMLATLRTGSIVKVHGVPRKIGQKHTVSANSIRPITDFNEYTCHFLDCIFAFQQSKGQAGPGAPQGLGPQGLGEATSSQRPVPPGGLKPAGPIPHPGSHLGGATQGRGADGFLPPDNRLSFHERILKFFADNERDPEGLHRDVVARNMQGHSVTQVLEAIDFLVQEGHLYSTIDEMHFKTLGEGQ